MQPQTRQALLDSIEKWRKNENVNSLEEAKVNGEDCPLCRLFVLATHSCEECPVNKIAGAYGCVGTPYYDAYEANYYKNIDAFRKHAKRERAFLESLLPKEIEP